VTEIARPVAYKPVDPSAVSVVGGQLADLL
jgi:hypothetical protein